MSRWGGRWREVKRHRKRKAAIMNFEQNLNCTTDLNRSRERAIAYEGGEGNKVRKEEKSGEVQ